MTLVSCRGLVISRRGRSLLGPVDLAVEPGAFWGIVGPNGDASVAAGPVGAGAKSNIVADLITFNRAKGVYGGLNFDGTVMTVSDDWNATFYGKKVQPTDIFVRMDVHNKAADKLLAQDTAAARKK